ncbi:Histidine triad nucleotide-binding protein 3 [Actinomortierella ambigua]|nr:Histidine triad nucleotide-binding protein 3 [Actinomortierella ambigua]
MVSISSLLCSILEGDPPDKLIYKDEHIAVFNDINPAAETHILIIPVKHIGNDNGNFETAFPPFQAHKMDFPHINLLLSLSYNLLASVKTVKPEDLDVLKRMHAKGKEILAERGYDSSNSKLGFHVPPFNTIDHLHLHVLGGEYRNSFRRKKYESDRMWYMDMSQLLEKVEKMKKIQEGARL